MVQYLTNRCRRRWFGCVLLLATAAWSGGCSPYQIEGLVVPGAVGEVLLLDDNDQRLRMAGIAGAAVDLTIDPSSMRPKLIGKFATDEDGRFTIPVDALGAGLLEYEVAVTCSAQGHQTVYQTMQMPARRKRLLVVMVPGRDTYRPKNDILKETRKMADELLKR